LNADLLPGRNSYFWIVLAACLMAANGSSNAIAWAELRSKTSAAVLQAYGPAKLAGVLRGSRRNAGACHDIWPKRRDSGIARR
jgi:hypothetical protein